jgi:hypothetical protein
VGDGLGGTSVRATPEQEAERLAETASDKRSKKRKGKKKDTRAAVAGPRASRSRSAFQAASWRSRGSVIASTASSAEDFFVRTDDAMSDQAYTPVENSDR